MPSRYVPTALKHLVSSRAGGMCEYCRSREKYAIDPLVMEHIQPISRGGKTTADNLALACQTCNNRKYIKTEAIDPVTNSIVPLFHPRKMVWMEHFTWNDDATRMLGLTPTGRATIALLRTNRESVMNMRRVLTVINEHPPD